MKIALVSTLFDPIRGHTLPFYNLAKGLTFLENDVTCYYSSKELKKDSYSVFGRKFISVGVPSKIFKIRKTFFSISPQLFRRLLNSQFDIIHTHEYASFNSVIAFIVAILKRKPILVTTPLYLPLWEKKWGDVVSIICHIFVPFMNIISSRIICASTASYQTHIRLGFKKSILCIVPNSIDTEEFKPISDKLLRKEINLKHKSKIVLIISKLYEVKGISNLFRAWRIIEESHSDLNVSLVIRGDREEFYSKLIDELKLTKVLFLEKFIPHNEMPRLYSIADIFVLPSNYEQWGQVLLEATCCQLPIVATKVGGIVDIVKDGETGLLVSPDSPEELAKALLKLLEDESLRLRMGLSSREYALRKFDYIKVSKKFSDIYKSVLY